MTTTPKKNIQNILIGCGGMALGFAVASVFDAIVHPMWILDGLIGGILGYLGFKVASRYMEDS